MATLLKDDNGIPIPQYANALGAYEPMKGADGSINANVPQLVDMASNLTSTMNYTNQLRQAVNAINAKLATAEDEGEGSVVALLAAIVSLLTTIAVDVEIIKNNTAEGGEL